MRVVPHHQSPIQEGNAQERLHTIQDLSLQLWTELNTLEGTTPLLEGAPPAGLVSFQLNDSCSRNTSEIVQLLGQQGIWIRNLEEPICLRACTHITTTPEELQRFVQTLQALLQAS